ncbi:MAG: thrombospondin type 3 repeat-containing protein, partial [Micrococcales bacterium]|nr:thrombospondin type 3 repeat-containing protein [Micrococcales bacterium]
TLAATFEGIDSVGGYSCRQNTGNTSQLSVHGTGRALDLMISTDGGAADNDLGDPIANWLVENAELVGVQFVIWDRSDWGAYRDPPKLDDYDGPNPHVDHIHMELSTDGAEMRTPWFADPDGDGVTSGLDVCPDDPDAGQQDVDADGVGDACQDRDGDGVLDVVDLCPEVADADQSDVDADGIGDACDTRDDRPVDDPGDDDPPGDDGAPDLDEAPDPDPTDDSPDADPGFGVDARHDGGSGLSAAGCAVTASRPSSASSATLCLAALALLRRRRSRG